MGIMIDIVTVVTYSIYLQLLTLNLTYFSYGPENHTTFTNITNKTPTNFHTGYLSSGKNVDELYSMISKMISSTRVF
jgi:hypothetical protein